MYFWYLAKKYVKNFLIVAIGLSLLFVVVDYTFNFSKLPSSSNLQVLYVFYIFVYAFQTLYPLAIIFGFLVTLSSLIKFNEFVSFYSLGFKPDKLFLPFLGVALIATFSMYVLQSTKLTYSNEYAQAIKDRMKIQNTDLFLKFNNKIIFIKELNPILKTAKDMRVFEINNSNIISTVFAKKAFFRNDIWYAPDAKIMKLTQKEWKIKRKSLYFLKNFKPKIISNLKKLNNISFYDAYLTVKYFKDVNVNKILSIVFFKIFTPLSLIMLMILLFYIAPIHIRLTNVPLFMVKCVIFAILLWASELMLYKFSKQGIIPYYFLSFPFVFMIFLDIYILRRKNEF